jgi:hypothetical protein
MFDDRDDDEREEGKPDAPESETEGPVQGDQTEFIEKGAKQSDIERLDEGDD